MDEIGQLSRAFDKMTEDLGKTTISIDKLNKEIVERKRKEVDLKEKGEKLRKHAVYIDAMGDALIVLNMEKKVIKLNKAAIQLLRYTEEDIPHLYFETIFPEKEHGQHYAEMKTALDTGTVRSFESLVLTKNGEEIPVLISSTALKDARNEPIGFIGVCRDITEFKRMEEELRRLSYLDGLTGVANRRRFDEALGLEWRRMTRDAKPLSLIMCDIDFFKAYNDTYGHQGGDDSLRLVANTLNSVLGRPGDLVARYGGEEYVVILPETDSQGAKFLAEKMRSRVESLGIIHVSSQVCEVLTISLGVATTIPTRGSLPDELISAADQALYEAKKEGRNRVNLAE